MQRDPRDIGVIILNYNESHNCQTCISYIKKQNYNNLLTIVVDNNSKEKDKIKLRQICTDQGVILLENKENKGYSAGNNIGLKYVTEKGCKYAIILNPDVEIRVPNMIKELFDFMENNEKSLIAGPDVINVDLIHQNPIREKRYFEELFWILDIFKKKKEDKELYVGDYNKASICDIIIGCCMIMRLSFLKEINYLDERVFLYCEEPILSKQVKKAGGTINYLPHTQVYHNHIIKNKDNIRKRFSIYTNSRIYYINNYSGYFFMKKKLLIMSVKLHEKIFSITHK